MSSAICFNMDQSEVWSSGNGLISTGLAHIAQSVVYRTCEQDINGSGHFLQRLMIAIATGFVSLPLLTTVSTMIDPLPQKPHFDALKICSCGKHCEKKEQLFVTNNFSFSRNVFLPYMVFIFYFKCTLKFLQFQFGPV